MNDRQDPYGEQRFYGYDEYGRPVYHDPYAGYDPYAGQAPPQGPPGDGQEYGRGYGYDEAYGRQGDPYQQYGQGAAGPPPPAGDPYAYGAPGDPYAGSGAPQGGYGPTDGYPQQGQYPPQDTYGAPAPSPDGGHLPQAGTDPAGYGATSAPYAADRAVQKTAQQAAPQWVPQQGQYAAYERVPVQPPGPSAEVPGQTRRPAPEGGAPRGGEAAAGSGAAGEEYRTEEFSFIEEEDEESEDVIDWLKFSESRTERREEAKRRGRNRVVALVAALVLALAGGVGYLWWAGMIPGFAPGDSSATGAGTAEKRDVIVVHLRDIDSGDITTALLVNNENAGEGTTVLLPNSLAISTGDGVTTTLGKAFSADGAGATRNALDTLLGSRIKGTWRLDTPYLENLVESVGGITLDADATVPAEKKDADPLVREGADRDLDGPAAVAYAVHREGEEEQTAQLARFGQVVGAVLKKLSSDTAAATSTVESLGQIPDPSLSDAQLGAALALLAEHAKNGDHTTELLPVEANGTLSDKTSEGLVKQVLGSTVTNSDPDAAVRVSVRNATGDADVSGTVRAALVNGGYTVVQAAAADSAAETSTVTYGDEADAEQAVEVAKTLGLPEESVEKGEGAANADVTVVLGADHEG